MVGVEAVALREPTAADLVVDIQYSGISTGTEKLLFLGEMPDFPGMGYPLVPGYEAVGDVAEAGTQSGFRVGERVFVPGANGYRNVRGLFGGAASRLVTDASRVSRVSSELGAAGALMALAATARHALVAGANGGNGKYSPPELIVGHGVLGRLLARLTIAVGAQPPIVWETDPNRRSGNQGYEVAAPQDDPRFDYGTIYDASGSDALLDDLVKRVSRGGEIVLAGFYSKPLTFSFPAAFMKEVRIRVAAEWDADDLQAVRVLVEDDRLSLEGLISHYCLATDAVTAYRQAFESPSCVKMILDWEGKA